MSRGAEYKLEVPSLDLLNRLVGEPLPHGLRAGTLETTFHRDVYFDATDWSLRRRGVTCRFRIRMDDRRILTVRAIGRSEGAVPLVLPQVFEAEVPELEGGQALAGTSEPARRLRALIEPGLLLPRVELETERRVRRAEPRWFARARFELVYDAVTVRGHQLAGTFQELKIRRLRAGRPSHERVAKALEQAYGLRLLLVDKLERAERLLRELEGEALARAVQGGREVAVVALEQGCIALRSDGSALRVPVEEGSGEDACRHVLRMCFGGSDGQVRWLGTAAAAGTRPSLEVWLASRLPGGLTCADGAGLEWLPLAEIVARVGSPVLRDAKTLAALTVAARSDSLPEWSDTLAATAPPEIPRTTLSVRVVTGEDRLTGTGGTPQPAPTVDPRRPSPEHLINGDLSWIEFNKRVLELAEDPRVPLLARVRFLSIFSANLDEFVMVRVGALKRAVVAGDAGTSDDGLTPQQQLDAIAIRLRPLLDRQARCLAASLLPQLTAHDVRILRWSDLSERQRNSLRRYFAEQVFPVLTPQAITRAPGHPFPLIPNLRLSLAVTVRDPRTGPMHFAYVKVPDALPRFVRVPDDGGLVPLEDVVRENLEAIYPGRRVEAAYAFRLTRSGDLELDEQQATSLLRTIEEEAKRRPYGPAVRLELERAMPPALRELLLRELRFDAVDEVSTLGPGDVYEVDGLLDLGALREIAALPLGQLQYPAFHGRSPIAAGRSIFDFLGERDLLVHHPYDSFEATVERFLAEAAADPDVLAIKLTLYRAGGRSGVVDALLRAAQAGKEVFVFVELKARFDEERNIEWAKKLEEAGIHVVYGLVHLKTHAKTALVVRREPGAVRRYVHIGTGNYNAATAALYTDLGLLSSDEALGADLNDLFNELSGSSRAPETAYRRLLVAPTHMLPRFLALIEREAAHARAGRDARICVKINGLTDPEMIASLYRASQAGVAIDLIVRGVCSLRPGVAGLSERIRVISVLGRFLEHARIFYFANGGEPEYYIGSADWRPRNLRRRVEVVAPVRDPACRRRLDDILAAELADPMAWELCPDGGYQRRTPESAADRRSAQERLMDLAGAPTA